MRATQQIFRVRRQYNIWVGNQTLEDYALRFTATSSRRWSIDKVAKTALGAAAFLALEAIAAAVTLNYGFINAFWAMLTVALVIFVTGFPISYYSAKYGLDIDLLTRSAGFGYLGSTITSLIYASFTFIFFAIEAAILASALEAMLGIPPAIGYILCAVAVIPIVTHGISAISKFQIGTQPVWLFLQILALVVVAIYEFDQVDNWLQYAPENVPNSHVFDIALFGAAASILFAMVAQIGEQVDYLRFMPEKNKDNSKQWWSWLILAGPGWIFIGMIKMLFGSFLAYLAITNLVDFDKAVDPTYMYQMAFSYITQSPTFALIFAGIFVVISQMKINVTNAYAGSIAWSNFFSRLTHSHPGRVVWLVFNVVIALILMELGIYRALESILGVFAIVAISWLACLSADLLINKPLGLSPKQIEFKRAHLYDINPVGVGSMIIASVVGILAYLGTFGETAHALAHFISLLICFISVPAIAWLTKGRFYLARESSEIDIQIIDSSQITKQNSKITCCICENKFESFDMSYCPSYQGPICSLCCSLDSRCLDSCKPHARASQQSHDFVSLFLPQRIVDLLNSRVGRFLAIFSAVNVLLAALLILINYQYSPSDPVQQELLSDTLLTVFFILMIVFGVISWLFLLAHDSREVAQQESNRQTKRLIEEIEAHKITDQSLQEAKEVAENANNAKSRYLTGISHELRTPLQSILGYAQLLADKPDTPVDNAKGLNIIRRNGEHLADLIEGLLDISKIEAGRLDIYRNMIKLPELLEQLVEMFSLRAQSKGIAFNYQCLTAIPRTVIGDEKRLKQILINLLSNAINYTEKGHIDFVVNYRNQVAEFCIRDTGVGISEENLSRVLDPFERVRDNSVPNISGTGLGLTIVKLLTEIMGGELKINSSPQNGSEFKVSLMLSRVDTNRDVIPESKPVQGYLGEAKTILVVDDEPIHRGLISDLLVPLGFNTIEAKDADDCAQLIEQNTPDLFILDVTMPGKSGYELAEELRSKQIRSPIIMVSADANEKTKTVAAIDNYDDYLVKPINTQALLEKISQLLEIQWVYRFNEIEKTPKNNNIPSDISTEASGHLREIKTYAELGYYKGINESLAKLGDHRLLPRTLLDDIQKRADKFQFNQIIEEIDNLLEENENVL